MPFQTELHLNNVSGPQGEGEYYGEELFLNTFVERLKMLLENDMLRPAGGILNADEQW